MNVSIHINGSQTTLGADALRVIAQSLPDIPHYAELFHHLSSSEISEVKVSIATKNNIKLETAKKLISDHDSDVLSQILRNPVASSILTTDDLTQFIDTGDFKLITSIISNFEEYQLADFNVLFEKLMGLNNKGVELYMAEGWGSPGRLIKAARKSNDPDIRYIAEQRFA